MYTDKQKAAYWKAQAMQARAQPATQAYAPRKRTLGNSMGHTLGSFAGGMLGSAIDPSIGGPIGEFLGGKLGHLAGEVMGFGDYTVKHNSVLTGGMSPPIIANTINRGGTVVRHREYIGDLTGSINFNVRKFPINPGNASTFPWLAAGPASSYEIYRLQGMLFEFVSTSSDAVLSTDTSSALGTINMATDYDALDDPYPDKISMLNSEFSNSVKPSCNGIHPIECKKSLTPVTEMYITKEGVLGPNEDPRLNDIGNFYIATEGQQADGGVLGELWVTYEVFLTKTQLNEDAGPQSDHFILNGVTNSAWLNNANLTGDSTLKGEVLDNNKYHFTKDYSGRRFLVTLNLSGTSAATIGEILFSISGGTPVDIWNAVSVFVQSPAGGTNSQYAMYQFVVDVTDAECTIIFGTVSVPGGTVSGDFIVTEVPFVSDSLQKRKKQPRRKRRI